jgi:manganese/zinc/iron transport system substrate-binding protein
VRAAQGGTARDLWESMMTIHFPPPTLGLALVLALLPGCKPADKGPIAERKIDVVTTIGMITDVVQKVGGERVTVNGLMGPGVDPHQYEASEGDLEKMVTADVIFYNGLHLEGQMGEVFQQMGRRTRTVAVTDRLDAKRDLRTVAEGHEGSHDPHVWFDVSLWMKAVEQVRDTLIDMDPTHAALYQDNASKYLAELAELHEYVKTQAAKISPGQRVLITAHDAFYYFGNAYGFEVRGLQGVSTATEAGARDRRELARFIAQHRVPAIFLETSVPDRNIESVIETVRKDHGFEVKLGGKLYSDALGDPGTPQGTYVGMVRHNIDTIVKALAQ